MEKIRAAESQGYVIDTSLTENSSVSDLQEQMRKIHGQRKRKMVLMAMKKTMVTMVAGLEQLAKWLSTKTRFQLRLEGLSDSVSEDITDYEPALGEIFDENEENLQLKPWMAVLLLLFHAAKSQHARNMEKDRKFEIEKLTWERDYAIQQLRNQQPAVRQPEPVQPPRRMVNVEPSSLLRQRLASLGKATEEELTRNGGYTANGTSGTNGVSGTGAMSGTSEGNGVYGMSGVNGGNGVSGVSGVNGGSGGNGITSPTESRLRTTSPPILSSPKWASPVRAASLSPLVSPSVRKRKDGSVVTGVSLKDVQV